MKLNTSKKNLYLIGSVVGVVILAGAVVMSGVLSPPPPPPVQQRAPEHPVHDEASFEQLTRIFTVKPFNENEMEFQIRLPAEWQEEKLPMEISPELSKKIIGELAQFSSPLIGIKRARVKVQAVSLRHEMDAGDWLRHYILSNSYIPEGDIIRQSNTRASGYFVQTIDNEPHHIYITAQFNADQAILVRFELPLPLKDYMTFLQRRAVDSFRMSYLKESSIEAQKVFTLADSVKFSYPASWEISAPDFRNINNLNVQLMNKSAAGVTEGFMRIVAVRRRAETSVREELNLMKVYFGETLGLNFVKMLSSEKFATAERFVFSRLETYQVESRANANIKQEVHLLLLGNEQFYIFVLLLTPDQNTSLYNWARNTRSYNMLINSIR